MKPSFLIVGAMRCGTTSLAAKLGEHPECFVSTPKETNFFSYEENYQKGIDWYEEFFSGATPGQAIGEASVRYSMRSEFPLAAQRIASALPNAQIIYLVRNPFDRLESHWRHSFRWARRTKNFARAMNEQHDWIAASRYWFQLSAFLEYFPRKQIHIAFLEDMKASPQQCLDEVLRFLGIDSTVRQPMAEHPQNPNPRNASATRRVDRPLARSLKDSSLFPLLRRLTPGWIRQRAGQALSMRTPGRPTWSSETRSRVADQLADDTARFLAFCEKPANFWSSGS